VELHKDVELDGKRYRIARMTATVGSGIVTQLLPKIVPFLDGGGSLDIATVIKMLPTISASELAAIQAHCLAVCSHYEENGALMPAKGIKELEYDIPVVLALTVQALIFNLAPFFTGGGLAMILQSVLGSKQSSL
jgi:hypothetical protein